VTDDIDILLLRDMCYSDELLRQVVKRFFHSSVFFEMRVLHDSMVSLAISQVVQFLAGHKTQ